MCEEGGWGGGGMGGAGGRGIKFIFVLPCPTASSSMRRPPPAPISEGRGRPAKGAAARATGERIHQLMRQQSERPLAFRGEGETSVLMDRLSNSPPTPRFVCFRRRARRQRRSRPGYGGTRGSVPLSAARSLSDVLKARGETERGHFLLGLFWVSPGFIGRCSV